MSLIIPVFDRRPQRHLHTIGHSAVSGSGSTQPARHWAPRSLTANNTLYRHHYHLPRAPSSWAIGGTTAAIAGNITDNANLTIDRSDDITVSGASRSGTGSVHPARLWNTITVTINQNYTGATTVDHGTLVVNSAMQTGADAGHRRRDARRQWHDRRLRRLP